MDKYLKILDTANNIIAPGSRCTISKIVEESVEDVLINKYGPNWREEEELFLNCYEVLRKSFKKDAYIDDIPYFYSMYYMLLNIPKIQLVLLQLLRKKRLAKKIRILDIGSSVGTTTIALLDLITLLDNLCELHGFESFFDSIEISSIEGSNDNIKVFKDNINYFTNRLSKIVNINKFTINQPTHMDIMEQPIEGSYDLIILSNVINEIPYKDRRKLLVSLSEHITENGEIIIIEPASKNAAKSLNKLKREIVLSTNLKSIAPCGICDQCEDCWIFRTSDIANAELIKYIDKLYTRIYSSKVDDFHNNRLKWCYCILSKQSIEDNCTNLSKAYSNGDKIVSVNLVGNRDNNTYKICDGNGNRGSLCGHEVELGYYNFGDFIILEDVTIEKNKEFKVHVTLSSNIQKKYYNNDNKKYIFENVKEKNLEFILKRLWGFNEFRDGQFEIIKNALLGKDILGILPTGAGKSVCYQLPAMIGNGISIIVSPLKSLIKDQVTNLRKIGFEYVDYIDSSKSSEEKKIVLSRFKTGSLKLLYVSPERLQMREFQLELKKTLGNFSIDYFIIDEAHCASEWGHDFRPAYLKLVDIVNLLVNSSIIAVTATASPKVKADILDIFKISEDNVINSKSLDRKEISLQVINLPIEKNKDIDMKEQLINNIPEILHKNNMDELHKDGSGIIFTIFAKGTSQKTIPYGTEHILDEVRGAGINSQLYHSKLDDKVRAETQDKYKANDFPLLVSTKGFGMGIDKSNIRYIIHMCYSNSLEAYYQEAGRSGRDGQHSHSIIIARSRDPRCIQQLSSIDNYEPLCVNSWQCHFTKGIRCDYGMQAKFISGSYPPEKKMKEELKSFYDFLLSKYLGEEKFKFIITKENDPAKCQSYLYYFQKNGMIKDYFTLRYIGASMNMEFGVIASDNFNNINISNIIDNIVYRLQNFKKQKYNMLQSMWEYVNNTTKCRRQFLMDYFEDQVSYGDEGCKFCDIDGISEEKAISVTRSLRLDKLLNDLNEFMRSNKFDHGLLNNLLYQMYKENIHESSKIRAMRYLEDYTNNPTALYCSCIITLKRDIKDAYARNQAYELVKILCKTLEEKQLVSFMKELVGIDKELVEQILLKDNELTSNSKIVNEILKTLENKDIKEMTYKLYVRDKVKNLSKSFK